MLLMWFKKFISMVNMLLMWFKSLYLWMNMLLMWFKKFISMDEHATNVV